VASPAATLETLRSGGKLALSRALSRIEQADPDGSFARFLDDAVLCAGGQVIGLTGPPGVGKSTLTDALIRKYRASNKTVGVLAIDPSSRLTGGALLGDRTRLTTDPLDEGVFVRSMAARDRLGGLSDHAVAAIVVMRSVMDVVIVETVGIGQSETDIAYAVDTPILCIQPGSGDSLQFMKAGVMELPEIVAVTKADMEAPARRALSDVSGALSLANRDQGGWQPQVTLLSARDGRGVDDLLNLIARHTKYLGKSGRISAIREKQRRYWLTDMLQRRFGLLGLERIDADRLLETARGPFSAYHQACGSFDMIDASKTPNGH